MANQTLPPLNFLRDCFDYFPDTGELRWKHRPDHHFAAPHIAQSWNTKLAGQPAFKWADDGYGRAEVVQGGKRWRLREHRVIFKLLTGEEPECVDHIDGDTSNNRPENLRAATVLTNRRNSSGRKTHLLPKGVSFEKGRFRAQGHLDGRKVHLGIFDTPNEAHAAFCKWAEPIHGAYFNPGPRKQTIFD